MASSGTNDIMAKFNGLALGEKIILIAAPLFFIDGFLPWFDYDVPGGPSRSAWSGDFSLFSMLAVIAAIVMAAQIAVARFTAVQLPALPQGLTWARVHLGLAAYIAVAVVLRLIIGESVSGFGASVDADMSFGLWIAVILAIALCAGAFLQFQAEQKGPAG